MDQESLSRRAFLHRTAHASLAGASLGRASLAAMPFMTNASNASNASAAQAPEPLAQAAIPSSGQRVARIGVGTWQTFDVGADVTRRQQLREVLTTFVAAGGDLVDSSPMYGSAEAVLGDLASDAGLRDRLFVATKVWTTGRDAGVKQMNVSLSRLRTNHVELMQVHNLVDWRTQLATLREWQQAGRVRYIGLTHYDAGSLDSLAAIVRREKVDFVQYALSLDEAEADGDFLKLCADRGVAFIANRPFGGGNAFARTAKAALPAWAAELDIHSWAQFLLKWVLGHPEVTCAIPGTSNPRHLADNLGAARGRLPDRAALTRMAAAWRAL